MASFWFISAPLAGHTDWGGMLKTAQHLQASGHQVLWVSEQPLEALISAAGVPFAPIATSGWGWLRPPPADLRGMSSAEAISLRYRRALDTWLSEALIPPAFEAILELAEARGAPDLIVTDPFLSAVAFAAEKLDVPMAVAGWVAAPPPDETQMSAAQAEVSKLARERLARLKARLGVRGVNFSEGAAPAVQSPHLHISYFNRAWYQADPEPLPQTQFVGGTVDAPQTSVPDWLAELPADAPLALITLGSVFTDDLSFFSRAAQAAAQLGMIPIVVLGRNPIAPRRKAELKAALPGGTRLLSWIDYDHVFPRLHVVVHHGGMGTTHRAAVQGVPQVVVPRAADQRAQARRVAQAKVGLSLSAHDVRNGMLLPAIRAVTTDPRVRTNAQQLAADLASLG
ncbi:MAG: glycosyltransferase family 1 protein, partial [Chloroflexi bacterium]|nr:glycosyltransferase family 1 protein [Chloroflexota bacterium]